MNYSVNSRNTNPFDTASYPCFNLLMGIFGPPDVDKLKARRDLKGLLAALRFKENASVRKNAAVALAELAEILPADNINTIVEPLIAALDDPDYPVTSGVVQALGAVGQPAVLPLITALRSPKERTREGAARALGRIGGTIQEPAYLRLMVDPLVGALKDSLLTVRRAAVWALGRIGPRLEPTQRGLPLESLILSLRDPAPDVRDMAASVLGRMGESRGIRPLVSALEDENALVRKSAAEGLDALGWHPTTRSDEAVYFVATRHWERAAAAFPEAVPAVLRALQDHSPEIRAAAAKILGQAGTPQVIEPLVQALHDPDSQVRRSAAHAIEQAGAPQALEALLAASRDPDHEVRRAVARALGHTADSRAIPTLISAIRSRSPELVKAGAQSLVQIGGPAVGQLIPLLREADEELHEIIADILAHIGSSAVLPLVEAMQNATPPVNEYAARILGRTRDSRAVWPLINALEDPLLACPAMLALGKLGDVRAVDRLLELLDSKTDSIQQAAAIGLGGIGDPRAVEPLIKVLKAGDYNTRKDAAEALLQMYHANRLDTAQKRRVLSQQERITEKHVDHESHVDNVRSSDCHRDESYHLDTGIGLEFPVK
jgi:HEAT repeat protein